MNVRYDMVAVHVVRPDAAGASHEFLQLRRHPDDYLGGAWSIIRGGIEPGELAWQAALRELREEAGLTPREFYKLSLMELFYLATDETIWHVASFVALVSRDDKVILNDEHDALRWVPRNDIDAQTMWAGERQIVQEISREILDNGLAKAHLRVALDR